MFTAESTVRDSNLREGYFDFFPLENNGKCGLVANTREE